eukprot:1512930-Pyramimonas_sp.AAC.1
MMLASEKETYTPRQAAIVLERSRQSARRSAITPRQLNLVRPKYQDLFQHCDSDAMRCDAMRPPLRTASRPTQDRVGDAF